jgi:ABC-2 type transport system permease protein
MNKLLILLKANVINTLKLNKLRNKSTGKISPLALFLAFLVAAIAFGFAFMYLFMFADLFSKQGLAALILPLGITAGSIVTLMTTLTTANGYLFRSSDFDMLMALPVKPRTVFSSKLFYLLLINYITLFFVYFPTIIVYAVYNQTDWIFWTLALPVFVLFPLGIIALGSVLSFLIGSVTSRFRYRNFLSLILTLGFFIFIMALSFGSSAIDENPSKFSEDMFRILNKIKVGTLVYESLLGNWTQLLLFLAVSFLPFAGFVYLVGRSYVKASMRSRISYTRKHFKMRTMKKSTQDWALFKREVKKYFSSNIYIMNTIVGPILTTIALVVMAFRMQPLIDQIAQGGLSPEDFPFVLTAIFAFMLGITSTTSCSLSLEGRQFWIIRSSPVSERQIFRAKILVNLMISVPFVLIDVIIANFIIKIPILYSLFMFLIPSLLAFFMSYLGLFINILFPRFDYENETKAVKQSLSVLLTMIFGFVGSALVLVPGFLVTANTGNSIFGYLIELGIEALLIGIVAYLLYSYGTKRYRKLVV